MGEAVVPSNRLNLDRLEPTPESHYQGRRSFLRKMGWGGLAVAGGSVLGYRAISADTGVEGVLAPGLRRPEILERFPARRNRAYDLEQPLSDERAAATYNNFYEFRPGSAGDLWRLTDRFITDPWTIEVSGQCHRPRTFDIDDVMKIEQEERTYRFRCVEAWAMDVPWTGFELNKLLAAVEPMDSARFVRFVTVKRPDQMPGMKRAPHYPWPYFEALRMDEAMNRLTLLVTGIYGRPLPKQQGAPFRIIVPWKYGYKSPKSIVKIELLKEQPKTFWETLQPREYPFRSNVDPNVPHPRWSQAQERLIGTGKRRPTLIYNGYGPFVAEMYSPRAEANQM